MPKPRPNRHKRPGLGRLRDLMRRIFRKPDPEPLDPYEGKLAPLRRGPKPRSGAAAVAEPDEE